jgi:ABC-type multidrug transport system permease subunit
MLKSFKVISALLNPFLIITFALFCGVTIPYSQIPAFWRSWLFQLDPFTRLVAGMVVTELHDRPVVCAPSELNNFTAPAGQTCGEYMNEFFTTGNGNGYIIDNATSACSYCAYKVCRCYRIIDDSPVGNSNAGIGWGSILSRPGLYI